MRIPTFVWWVIGIAILLVVLVLLKVNLSIGTSGFHITQGLIK